MEKFQVSSILNNRYKIVSVYKIESGTIIYRTEDLRFPGETWLIHQLDISENINSPSYLNNFFSLLSFLSKVIYEKIGKIVDYFTEKDCLIVVTEELPGVTLSEIIYTTTANPIKTIKLALQLLEIIKFLYSKNIINFCDINPENIIVDKQGMIKIISFGISKLSTMVTDKGIEQNKFLGTLGYVPPEMIDDDPANIKEHSYIYVISAIMYEYVTKISPYSREDPFFFPPISSFASTFPNQLNSFIEKCLSYNPANRIKTFKEFEKKLISILKNESEIEEISSKNPIFSLSKNQSLFFILVIILIQLFIILAFFVYYIIIL
ncbi:MAG: serine/threonine protein kinase [bacterium]